MSAGPIHAGIPPANPHCLPPEWLALVRASKVSRAHFEAMVANRPMLKPAEAAYALNCDLRTITRLYENRELRGYEFNTSGGERMQRRIERWSVCSVLLRKANYTAEDHLLCLVRFINALTEEERALLRDAVTWHVPKISGGKS